METFLFYKITKIVINHLNIKFHLYFNIKHLYKKNCFLKLFLDTLSTINNLIIIIK